MYPRWPQTFWAAWPNRPFGLFWLWDHLGNISLGNLDLQHLGPSSFFEFSLLGSWHDDSRTCSTAARLRGKRWATSISSSCRGGCNLSPVLTSDSILSSTGPSLDSGRPCILIEPLLPHCSMSSSFASKVSTCLQSLFMMASFFSRSRFWDWMIKVCSWIASVSLSKVGFKTSNSLLAVPSSLRASRKITLMASGSTAMVISLADLTLALVFIGMCHTG